jgi:hypothetical protein
MQISAGVERMDVSEIYNSLFSHTTESPPPTKQIGENSTIIQSTIKSYDFGWFTKLR